ncbi:hypothetical protein ABZT17_36460 [Streptomyces sp. NPDC005648]|uniref:hypothetical protein n=1 Tax=Streptomyces sp. NPDC005648 TaxID=3157044 RepID=UPI0033A06688
MVPGEIAEGHPDAHPQRCPEGVEGQKPAPGHLARAGDDAVGLAQALDEAGDGDDLPPSRVKNASALATRGGVSST